ncbi:MAG: translation initiation factor IF-2 [Alphaproteobacteria bacterium]
MSDKDSDTKGKKTLSLSKGKLELTKKPGAAGNVRQNLSHGRSKPVEVEIKRRRPVLKGSAGSGNKEGKPEDMAIPDGMTKKEWEMRLQVLRNKQSRSQEMADQANLDAENARKRSDATKEDEDRKIAEARAIEEARELREAEEAAAKAALEAETAVEEEIVVAPEVIPVDIEDAAKSRKAADKASHKKPVEDEEDEAQVASRKKSKSESRKAAGGRKREGKLTLEQAQILIEQNIEDSTASEEDKRNLSQTLASKKTAGRQAFAPKAVVREVEIPDTITVQDLAAGLAIRANELIKALMKMGQMVTINQSLDADTAELVVTELGHTSRRVQETDFEESLQGAEDTADQLKDRPPVVTIMGHVDHGKTSLLDALRHTDVVAGEAGGITQHIGAYQIQTKKGDKISFIDTPGHAAFTEMRARGAKVTDIVILVVAADDGVKEQTIEAINHVRAAGVPMIVAINKIDKPGANPDRVKNELLGQEIVLEELGGDILSAEISAKERKNLDKIIDAILLQSEVLELKANPNRVANGAVIEARMEKGRGPVATVLVQRGTLKVGDIFVAGTEWGRARALMDDKGAAIREAGPAMPVEILGFNGAPDAGDDFIVVDHESTARDVVEHRLEKARQAQSAKKATSIEDIFAQRAGDEKKVLNVVIKADVHGSAEAIVGSLQKLETDEVGIKILHTAVGGITESDVILANASEGLIFGFNVRANPQARNLAEKEGVGIRYYSVIYDIIDEIKALMSGLLSPKIEERYLGRAEIRQVFNVTKSGKIAGCMVTEGMVKRGAKVRLLRDDVVIHEGALKTLRRFKDEAKEVKEGYECGMAFENYQDIREGDVIECFELEEIARQL